MSEKGNDYPVKRYRVLLQQIIRAKFGWQMAQMLFCTVCTSFWSALAVDVALFFFSGGRYFLWPLSGFATLGLTWTVIEYLNAQDKTTNQNPSLLEGLSEE
ncbi:MAG: hypothetical protein HC888_06105 [Candidatus Competibacteraceae bacterium]|nr:hypothetical protein [Candidatus Competibacteraceae bacterium]